VLSILAAYLFQLTVRLIQADPEEPEPPDPMSS
jgi:hypothetical protein